jgi:hypothetical protein
MQRWDRNFDPSILLQVKYREEFEYHEEWPTSVCRVGLWFSLSAWVVPNVNYVG